MTLIAAHGLGQPAARVDGPLAPRRARGDGQPAPRRARDDGRPAPRRARPAGWGQRLAGGGRAALLAGLVLAGLVLVLAGAGPAQAMAVAGDRGLGNSSKASPSGGRGLPLAPTAAAVGATLELINGRIDAVDAEGGAITVRGKSVALHPTRLRVVGTGGQLLSGARALRPGMQVRFALEPEAPAARAIVLIYIDSQP